MWETLKEKVNNIFTAGEKARTAIKTPSYQKTDPEYQKSLQSKFLKYAISKPQAYLVDSYNKVQRDRTPNIDNFRFRDPMKTQQQHAMERPEYQKFSSYMAEKLQNLRNRPVEGIKRMKENTPAWLKKGGDFAKTIGNTALDFTTRPVARLAANSVLSFADALTKGDLPTFQAKDTAGKLLFGDVPVASFQSQTKSNSDWLQNKGVSKGLSNTLGFGGMAIGAVLDAPIVPAGGAKKKIASAVLDKLDDVAEVAWKSASRTEKLKTLITGKDQLIKSGWTAEAATKLNAKDTFLAIKNGITPKEWMDKAEESIRNTPLWNDFKTQFTDWVGKRQASKFEGIASTEGFKRLDELGTQAFGLIESGEHKQVFQSLRELLDGQWKKLNEAGIRTGYIESYLPHLWKESESEAAIAMGRKLSKSSQFSLSRIIKDYQDGLAANLHPKYEKLSDVIGAYVMSTEKSVADKQFFDWLKNTKTIMTQSEINKVPKELKGRFANWVTINGDRFGFDKLNQSFKADPEMAGVIDNYLMDYGSNPSKKFGIVEKALKAGAALNTQLKNWKLSAGVPSTGINSFGLMSVRRHMYAGTNPIKNLAEGWSWILKPSLANKIVQSSTKELPDAVKHGLTVSIEDMDFFAPVAKEYKNVLSKSYGVVASKLEDWFSKPLFQNVLPAMKIKTYNQNIQVFLKQGLDEKSAKELSAQVTNDIYGGLNLDRMMRDKGTQTFVRNLFLAPDLYESQVNVGKGLVKMFKKDSPEAKVYQTYARNMLMDLINRNVVNKVLSGKYMFENSEGNKLNLDTGTYQEDGTHRYIKGYGNDVVKIPFDIVDGIWHKDFGVLSRTIRNRLSMTTGTGYGIATNTNYAGNKLYYPDDSPVEKGLAIGNEALGLALPSQASAVGRFTLGKQGLEQTATQLAELPIYYREGPYSKEEKADTKLMQQGGMSGKSINEARSVKRDIKNAPKLSAEEEARNLAEGLPVNTQRNWLGKPISPSVEGSEGQETGGNVGMAGTLSNYAKEAKATSDKKALVKQIYESLDTDEQISKALKANGITEREAITFMVKDLTINSGQRPEYLYSIISQTQSKDEMTTTIMEMAKDDLLTAEVVKYWEDKGTISDATGKEIRNIIKAVKGQKITGGGSKSKAKPPKLNLPKLKMSSLNVKMPKLSSAGDIYKFKPKTVGKTNQVAKLPTLADMKLAVAKMETNKLPSVPQGWSR